MSEEPFLILHKVRGEPAFDIAIKMVVIDEEWWIIPTSGHRAYPYANWKIKDLVDASDFSHEYPVHVADRLTMPNELRDHYVVNASPDRGPKLDISSLIAATSKPLSDRRF